MYVRELEKIVCAGLLDSSNSGKGLCMIVLVSLIVLLRGFPCFPNFSHGASHPYIHRHSFNGMIFALVCYTVYSNNLVRQQALHIIQDISVN